MDIQETFNSAVSVNKLHIITFLNPVLKNKDHEHNNKLRDFNAK